MMTEIIVADFYCRCYGLLTMNKSANKSDRKRQPQSGRLASSCQPAPADLPAKGPPSAPVSESYVSTLSVALRAQQKLNPFMLLH